MWVGFYARHPWTTNGPAVGVKPRPTKNPALRKVKMTHNRPVQARRPGFTLIEVLLVLALIGSVTGLFLMSLDSIARTTPGDSLEGAFWAAMRDAREAAVRTRRTQAITFDPDGLQFVVTGGDTQSVSAVNRDGITDAADVGVFFMQVLPTNSFTLLRGRLVTEREIPAMFVFSDGTCQPVTVELRFPGGPRRLPIDPWTCAEMLDSGEETRR